MNYKTLCSLKIFILLVRRENRNSNQQLQNGATRYEVDTFTFFDVPKWENISSDTQTDEWHHQECKVCLKATGPNISPLCQYNLDLQLDLTTERFSSLSYNTSLIIGFIKENMLKATGNKIFFSVDKYISTVSMQFRFTMRFNNRMFSLSFF